MQQLSRERYSAARAYLAEHGRPLESTLAETAFDGGDTQAVLGALAQYQNADGGFGHALEPDARTPSSSALANSIALSILAELGVEADNPLVQGAVRYLTETHDPESLVWRIVPRDVNEHPHAPWWHDDAESLAQGFGGFQVNPRAELVASLWIYASLVPSDWLTQVTASTVAAIESRELDPHDLICAVKLAESTDVPEQYRQRIRPIVIQRAQEIVARAPEQWREYNPQPLWFVSGPRSLLAEPLAEILPANLDFLIEKQTTEGCWEPNWSWGDFYPDTWPKAQRDARSLLTFKALRQLDAFGWIAQ